MKPALYTCVACLLCASVYAVIGHLLHPPGAPVEKLDNRAGPVAVPLLPGMPAVPAAPVWAADVSC